MQNLTDLRRRLEAGKLKSRDLVETCLERIADTGGEGARAFLTVHADSARAVADLVDEARKRGLPLAPFAGVPISIKDLYDVKGEVTRAGSHVLDDAPPATADADAVTALRRAGFVIVGKTNMTEFAYSGLGVNPHFGTPLSPFERHVGRVPGGSTSGGAVAVADGMTPATLGSDTGGSTRIPAAFCGIVGFKPTTRRLSKRGAFPLSTTLDSVGPMATSVSCCAVLDSVLSGGAGADEDSFPEAGLRLGVIEGYVDEGLDPEVAAAFSAALTRLSQRGVRLSPVKLPELLELPEINRKGGLVGAEAWAVHRPYFEPRKAFYDPWVRARIEAFGANQSAADYIDLLNARARVIAAIDVRTRGFDALVTPTVAVIPPTMASVKDPEAARAINFRCLRNANFVNFLDRTAITIPCHRPGEAPVGLMLVGETLGDRRLLSIARGLEGAIRAG